MTQKRLAMRKIKEVLRLYFQGGISSRRHIGQALGLSKSAAGECLQRALAAGLSNWAQVEALDDASLEQRLYPPTKAGPRRTRVQPPRRCKRSSISGVNVATVPYPRS